MSPRSHVPSSKRPLSAIFLGSLPHKDPKEANIPDLPEPLESPNAISSSRFLPSPPATNSPGSGSTGDNNSANSGSVRQRSASHSASPSIAMPTKAYDKPTIMLKTSRPNSDDEDDEDDHAGEEDHTARPHHRVGVSSTSENNVALQRVKTLAQRNRMALDKLSSRLNTSSPTSTSRSPNPPSSASTTSLSRLSSRSHSISQLQRNDTLSGSETERESMRAATPRSDSHSYRSSSPERSSTPRSASSSRPRRRLISAPTSSEIHQSSPSLPRTPRKRTSIASAISVQGSGSPTGRKSRKPLPFREELGSLNGRNSIESMTPHHAQLRDHGYNGHLLGAAAHTAMNASSTLQYSSHGARSTRFSTVRDLTRRHQARWLPDDISGNTADDGRRQSRRGGSAESALNYSGITGRLAGESLRAAGISMRGSGRQLAPSQGDVFSEGRARVARSSVAGPGNDRAVESQDKRRPEQFDANIKGRTDASRLRGSETLALPVRPHLHSDPSRVPTILAAEQRDILSRPTTSVADYHQERNASRNGTYSVRSRRSTHDLSDRPESRQSQITRDISMPRTPSDPDEPRKTMFSGRSTSLAPAGNSLLTSLNNPQSAEHTLLMLESLSMFQTQLSRFPSQSQTARDLADHSATIIRSSERLNKILRAATTNAVQQQIAIEIDDKDYEDGDPNHPAQIWRDAGSDFRESLRESDGIVRSLTGFILGVGKLLKEVAGTAESAHLRSRSLDDDVVGRHLSDSGVESVSREQGQDDRRSVESRWNWESMVSSGGTPFSRDRGSASDQYRSASSRNSFGPPSTSRRIATNESIMHDTLSNVVDLSTDYEPSPTPASRHSQAKPPAFSTPPPLPTLPSESLLQRSNTALDKSCRRNASLTFLTSKATSHNPNIPFALPTPNPTTATLTHTTSPEASTFPLHRTCSRDSIRSSIAFSRPSEASVTALQQQQNRDEARRRPGETTEGENTAVKQVVLPLSGSEAEDTCRETLDVRSAHTSLETSADEPETEGDVSRPAKVKFPSQRQGRRVAAKIFG